jgi:hypothetical protein
MTELSRPAVRRLAWTLCALAVTLAVASIVLAAVNGESPAELVTNHHAIGILDALVLPVLGALIVRRDPRHLLGWLMGVGAVFLGVFNFTQQWAPLALGLSERRASLPGGVLASWLASWTNVPGIVIGSVFLVLLFPDGRVPSPRWRPLAWAGAVVAVVPTVVLAVGYWPLRGPALLDQSGSLPPLVDSMFGIAFAGAVLLSAASVVALVLRFRRAGALQRQQIKWFAYGAVLSLLPEPVADAHPYGPYLELLGTAILLGCVGIGIFRYRLWEIDRLLSRTLVYGLLSAILGGAYAGLVLALGPVFGRSSSLAVAVSTLAVAALFQPLRHRIQRAVDRRFNRRRYDAAQTIEAFATRLREHTDLHALTSELLTVVDHTMQPTRVSLWLKPERPA